MGESNKKSCYTFKCKYSHLIKVLTSRFHNESYVSWGRRDLDFSLFICVCNTKFYTCASASTKATHRIEPLKVCAFNWKYAHFLNVFVADKKNICLINVAKANIYMFQLNVDANVPSWELSKFLCAIFKNYECVWVLICGHVLICLNTQKRIHRSRITV